MKHLLTLPSCLLTASLTLCLFGQTASAQILHEGVFQRQARMSFHPGQTDTIRYFEVRDSAALFWLVSKIRPENYPLSIVKKPVIDPFFDLIQHYESQLNEYRALDKSNITLDSIQQLKIAQLEQLNQIQIKRVENYKQLSDDMSKANAQLSEQIKDALLIAKGCDQGKVRKRLWAAAVGAGIGFTLAGLIAFVK